jgi:hypothetical protein
MFRTNKWKRLKKIQISAIFLHLVKDKNTYHKLTQAPHIENKIIIYS